MPTTAPASNLLAKGADPKPLYYRLKEILKREMEQDFEPHQRFHSVRELTRRHDVSAITVTRALRELVSERYLYAQQGKGMFVCPRKQATPSPATRQVLTISLPLGRPLDEALREPGGIRKDYLLGIADAGREYGAVVEFQQVPTEWQMDFFLHLIGRESPHGVILYGSRDPNYPHLIESAIERGTPYVAFQPERCFTWEQVQRLNLHYVTTDQQDGIRQATHHLIDLGHRRIAYWEHMRTAFTRLAGYRAAMQAANIDVDETLVRRDFDFDDSCEQALRELIDAGVTALVTSSDYVAMQVLRDAQRAGIDVPGQLSVTGFDDNPGAKRCTPALTTVSVSRYQAGRELAMALIHQFRHPESTERYRMLLPAELIVRESTGRCEHGFQGCLSAC